MNWFKTTSTIDGIGNCASMSRTRQMTRVITINSKRNITSMHSIWAYIGKKKLRKKRFVLLPNFSGDAHTAAYLSKLDIYIFYPLFTKAQGTRK